jgi:hypothetical protein
MQATDRRRNLRPEACRSCGKFCEAGQGYLYRDTSGGTVRRLGRFGWFVKCAECHSDGKSRLTVSMERHAAANPPALAIRPWSVAQVKRWTVVRVTHEGDVALRLDAGSFSEIISDRDRINSRFTAPTGYALEQAEFADKPLSANAAAYLESQILPLVNAIQAEEQLAGEEAAAKLATAGATVTPLITGYGWRIEYRGGHYTLWGCVGGKNSLKGFRLTDEGERWTETTAEKLLS